jgi:hypothetical protein
MSNGADFNWVKARHECSLTWIFESLKADVEKDVAIRRELSSAADRDLGNFRFQADARVFEVFCEGDVFVNRRSVKFRLTNESIEVSLNEHPILDGVPTLGDDEKCRLKVGDFELELWQFRKRALEQLFFGPVKRESEDN